MTSRKIKTAVFASGKGTNFEAIVNAQNASSINIDVRMLVYNNKNALVKNRADKLKIQSLFFNENAFDTKEDFENEMIRKMKDENIEFVLLAGWMRILSRRFLKIFPHTLNIHPSLLPAHPGKNAIEMSYRMFPKVAGCTVHRATEEVDAGPIIFQLSTPMSEEVSFAEFEEKVHQLEHELYPKAIGKYVLDYF